MLINLLNIVNDLTNPDDIPSGYGGGLDLNNGGWAFIVALLVIIFILLFVIIFLVVKIEANKMEYKKSNQTDLTEEEKQTITELRKLTAQEKQIINDTIKAFNKNKEE